jgi:hypothetical protein
MSWNWDWFNNPNKDLQEKHKIGYRNYHNIARDKNEIKKEILADPKVLFKVVDSVSDCMCGGLCNGCEYNDVLFIDLIVREKSLTEKDILDLLEIEKVKLDMFKLSEYVSFSINTLKKYENEVNWKSISEDYKYKKNINFINFFHNKINWEKINCFDNLSPSDIEKCVFIDKIVPIKNAIDESILKLDHIKKYVDILAPYCNDLICKNNRIYGVKILEELNKSSILPYLINYVEIYTLKCIEQEFLTRKYVEIIKLSNRIKTGDWSEFIKKCKPDEEFLLEHIIDKNLNNLSKDTWDSISIICKLSNKFIEDNINYLNLNILVEKNKCNISVIETYIKGLNAVTISKFQKLTPEFIDMCIKKYPEKLDWYYLCEFQDLPEDLMRKNIDKLNWGQVSWYQMMSKEFLEEYSEMLNEIKLKFNKKIKL